MQNLEITAQIKPITYPLISERIHERMNSSVKGLILIVDSDMGYIYISVDGCVLYIYNMDSGKVDRDKLSQYIHFTQKDRKDFLDSIV